MENDIDSQSTNEQNHFSKLKHVSPTLYRVCIIIIGLAAALAIYKTIAQSTDYEEIAIFVGIGIALYCVGILLDFLTKTEVRRVVFAALVVLSIVLWYIFVNLNITFFGNFSPSARFQTTWCEMYSILCGTNSNFEPTTDDIVSSDITKSQPNGQNSVYFHFAGSLSRQDDIIPFLEKITALGWNGQEFDKGGKRTGAADGINVIGFYYESDRENAQRLANAVLASEPPRGSASSLRIQMLNSSKFKNPPKGTLEIWISNN
jgi:multidrug transporter EmrE-like cation transporter